MITASTRVFLGCIAGALSVLMFHQPLLEVLFWLGLTPQAAFRLAVVPPFHAPMVVSITFWGAVYGSVFGWLSPRLPRSILIKPLLASLFAMVMSWFIVRPLAGYPVASNWQLAPLVRSAAADLMWGFGITLILPLLQPRGLSGLRHPWKRHLAT